MEWRRGQHVDTGDQRRPLIKHGKTRKGASFRFHQIQVFVDGKEAKQTLDQDSRFGEQVITNEHGNRRTNGKETVPSYAGSKWT